MTADVSKPEDVEAMTATVERELGPIDLLVNNAGVGPSRKLPWEEDPADWWRVFEINVLGPYLCCRAVLPGMVERGRGRIVNPFGDDAPWTPPELAPRLVRALASGRADRLAGRYIHAEHDDVDALVERADEIEQRDLNAIRLQR